MHCLVARGNWIGRANSSLFRQNRSWKEDEVWRRDNGRSLHRFAIFPLVAFLAAADVFLRSRDNFFPPIFAQSRKSKLDELASPRKRDKKVSREKKSLPPKVSSVFSPVGNSSHAWAKTISVAQVCLENRSPSLVLGRPLDSLPHTFISRVREHRKHRGSKRVGYAFPLVCSDLIVFVHVSMGVKTSIRNGSIHARIPPTNSWR